MAESYRAGDSVWWGRTATACTPVYCSGGGVGFGSRRTIGTGFVPVVVETPEMASEAPTGRMEIVLGAGRAGGGRAQPARRAEAVSREESCETLTG